MTPSTRRELIFASAAAAGLAGLGAVPGVANASTADDAEQLKGLVTVEQLSVFAYAHILQAVSLSAASSDSLRMFLGHEHEHVALLEAALARSGATAPSPPATLASADRQLSALHVPGNLGEIKTETDALHFLIGVETLAEGAYYASMSRLSDRRSFITAAQVMCCEAQHWTALSGLLHSGDVYRAVPYPVVLG